MLLNTRKNTTWAYEIFLDWLAEKEQQRRKTVSKNLFLVHVLVYSLAVACPLYVLCLCAYCLLLLFTRIFPIPVVDCFFYQSLVECCSHQLCVECCQLGVECCSCCKSFVKCSYCQLFVVEFVYYHSRSWPLYSRSHTHPVNYRFCTGCHMIFRCNIDITPDVS